MVHRSPNYEMMTMKSKLLLDFDDKMVSFKLPIWFCFQFRFLYFFFFLRLLCCCCLNALNLVFYELDLQAIGRRAYSIKRSFNIGQPSPASHPQVLLML